MEYRYSDTDSVSRVRLPLAGKHHGALEAKIFLPAHPVKGQKPLDQYLRDKGLNVVYDVVDNQPALAVSGFVNPRALLQTLAEGGYAKGQTTPAATPDDTPKELTTWQKICKHSLRLSAVFYMMGNIFSIMSGVFRYDKTLAKDCDQNKGAKAQVVNGAAFSFGDIIMLGFGHQNFGHKYDNMLRGMHELMTQENMDIPAGGALPASQLLNGSPTEKAGRFMRRNVIVFKSLSEITAGAALIVAGLKQQLSDKVRAGALLITGFGGGLLIHEKKPADFRADKENDPDAHHGGLKKVTDAIQRKPLIFSGTLAFANNLFVLRAGLKDKKKRGRTFSMSRQGKFMSQENGWIMDVATAVSFMFANTLYAMSSKNVGGRVGESLDDKMYTVAANMVLAQPEEKQERALHQLAKFLDKQPDIDATEREAEAHIRGKLTRIVALNPLAPKGVAPDLTAGPALAKARKDQPVLGAHTLQVMQGKGDPQEPVLAV